MLTAYGMDRSSSRTNVCCRAARSSSTRRTRLGQRRLVGGGIAPRENAVRQGVVDARCVLGHPGHDIRRNRGRQPICSVIKNFEGLLLEAPGPQLCEKSAN
jgi:hypothetical protein